jgi:hypothetical protein
MALWLVNLTYASYLVMLQHVLRTRPYPFSLYSCASIFGDIGIILVALPQFRQVIFTCLSCDRVVPAGNPAIVT